MARLGKGILENLTQAMYDDSRIIYREYIQNSSDQIDIARKNNSFPNEKLEIIITIDIKKRNIYIRDTANGIPAKDVEKRLGEVADSEKVQGESKGFRGIGRLGGVGYCRELRFVTTYRGETKETTMIWNAKRLQEIIADSSNHTSAEDILDEVINYEYKAVEKEQHYFEVQMLGINEADDKLLDYDNIKQYIAEVAPVDFKRTFLYRGKIYDFINSHDEVPELNTYDIGIRKSGGDLSYIFKEYPTAIYRMSGTGKQATREKIDDIRDIHTDIIYNTKGTPIAWIWYAISSFQGAINELGNPWRFLRLRQFNIQIGNNDALSGLFKESRGNSYFMGEVHTIDKRLRPNARRDNFNETPEAKELENALKEYFKQLSYIYKSGSVINSAYKKIKKVEALQETFKKKVEDGKFVNNADRNKAVLELEKAQKDAEAGMRDIAKFKKLAETDTDSAISKVVTAIGNSQALKTEKVKIKPIPKEQIEVKAPILTDNLTQYDRKTRKVISQIYSIIKKNMENEDADALIEKIHEELKKS